MTPLARAEKALADELLREEPQKGGTYFVDTGNRRAAVIDGTFDLQALARAVLTAIREPSEGMVSMGLKPGNYVRGCAAMYTAMIDAALAGEPR